MDEKEFNNEMQNDGKEAQNCEQACESCENCESCADCEACTPELEETSEQTAEQSDTALADAPEKVQSNSGKGITAAIIVLSVLLVGCIAAAVLYFTGIFNHSDRFAPSSDNVDFDYMGLSTVSASDYVDEDGYFDYKAADLSKYIEVCDYKKLTVYLNEFTEVTDADVEDIIAQMLESAATLETVEREAKEGDTLNISFVGYMDGEVFDGGSADNQSLALGSGTYIDGFESGLIGASAGDKVVLELTFPTENYDADFAGKDVTFEVTVNSVNEYVIPELTDEFIAENTYYDNVADFRDAVREDAIATNKENYEQTKRTAAWTAFIEHCRYIALPQESIDYYFNYFSSYYAQMANYYYQMMGLDIATVYELLGINDDVLKELSRQYVCEDLVYYSVVGEIKITDDEYQAALEGYLEDYGVTEEEFFASYTDEEGLRENVKYNKLIDIILDTCEIKYLESEN